MRISEETISIGHQQRITTLLGNIHNWGVARNIIGGATPQAQFLKLVEEAEELHTASARGAIHASQDGLGDVIVVAAMIAGQIGRQAEFVELVLDASRDDIPYTDGSPQSAYVYPDIETGNEDLLLALGRLAAPLARGKAEETMRALYMVVDAAVTRHAVTRHAVWLGLCYVVDGVEHETERSADLTIAALEMAWDEIKDRKGVVLEGVFIKSDDMVYPNALAKLGRHDEAAAAYAELHATLPKPGELS